MTITTGLCVSFKLECLQGIHDLRTDVLKIALYGPLASLGPETTAYTSTGEVSASGYSAGGQTIAVSSGFPAIQTAERRAVVCFDEAVWSPITVEAYGALIYNSSKANRAIAVAAFTSMMSSVGGPLRVRFPLTSLPPIIFA